MLKLIQKSLPVKTSILLLFFGGVTFFFSNGLHANFIMAWFAPIFFLRFARQSKPFLGFLAIAVTTSVASFFMNRGMIPIPFGPYIVINIILGSSIALPCLADRIISPNLPRFLASLVFPSAVVSGHYLSAMSSPFGTWGNDAYIQFSFLPLTQVASLVGIWGITFIIMWFTAGVNDLWQEGWPQWRKSKTPWLMGTIAILIISFSGYRPLILQPTKSIPLVAAAISNPSTVSDRFFAECPKRNDYQCRQRESEARHDILFDLSREAVSRGAKLVSWYEGAAQYDEQFEAAFLRRARNFAQENKIYFVFGAISTPNDSNALLTNKAVVIAPDGTIVGNYLKAHPVPGEPILKGNGDMLLADTPYGRLGVVICFDADFTSTSRKAAVNDVDILIAPSNDWREISTIHAEMAVFRAVESGASLIRATSNGSTVIADPFGNILSSSDSFESSASVTIAELDTGRVPTVYGHIGDIFAILCLLLTLIIIGWHMLISLSRKGEKQ
jgi:apolipoprotein N-acyltransferase